MTTNIDFRRAWSGFGRWRRTRPFWAGVFTLIAALVLLYPPYSSLRFGDIMISVRTMGGVSALVIGAVMIACAGTFWFRPAGRFAAGIVTLILSVVAMATVNLGSFLLGTLLGLIGAALAIGWSPKTGTSHGRRRRRTHPETGDRAKSARFEPGQTIAEPVGSDRAVTAGGGGA